jgi:hypothetical protein
MVSRVMMNSVPTPSLLFTLILPPMDSITFLLIERPRPVPYLLRDSFSVSLPKSTKRFLTPCSDMPTPVSLRLIWISTSFWTLGSGPSFSKELLIWKSYWLCYSPLSLV